MENRARSALARRPRRPPLLSLGLVVAQACDPGMLAMWGYRVPDDLPAWGLRWVLFSVELWGGANPIAAAIAQAPAGKGAGSYRRLAVCRGHSSFVMHVDFSRDATMLQSNDAAHEILYWDAETGKQITNAHGMRDVPWASWTCAGAPATASDCISRGGGKSPRSPPKGVALATRAASSNARRAIVSPASRIAPAGLRSEIVPASDAFRLKSIFITSTSQKSPQTTPSFAASARFCSSLSWISSSVAGAGCTAASPSFSIAPSTCASTCSISTVSTSTRPASSRLIEFDGVMPASGTVDEAISLTDRRLGVFSGVSIEADAPEALLDQELTGEFSFTVDGAPPASHVIPDAEIPGLASELPIAYHDVDASGGLTEGDTPESAVCHDGKTIALLWLPQPTLPEQVFFYMDAGIRPGWQVFHADEIDTGGAPLVEAELAAMSIDPSCTLPE